jgi:hypothetical protein
MAHASAFLASLYREQYPKKCKCLNLLGQSSIEFVRDGLPVPTRR